MVQGWWHQRRAGQVKEVTPTILRKAKSNRSPARHPSPGSSNVHSPPDGMASKLW